MIKRFVIFLVLFITFSVLAVQADEWDNFSDVDRMWDGQKAVTNQEFEQVMDALEEKSKIKEEKKQKKKLKKMFGGGTTLHKELNPDKEIKELGKFKSKEDGILLNVPVQLIINNKVLENGYYKLIAERDEETKKIYVNFYQSQFFKAKLEVIEIEDDYGEETLDFAKILPYNDSFVKIIFGSIDFNAYAFIPFVNQ